MHTPAAEYSGFIGILIVQVTILIVFGIFVRYDYEMLPIDGRNMNSSSEELATIEQQHKVSYPRKWFFSLENQAIIISPTITNTLTQCGFN